MNQDIPKSDRFEFKEKSKAYALIIGVYNEGDKFVRQLESLQPYRHRVDIIIADGGSTDGATLPKALQTKARTLLINKDEQRGLSVQYRSALHYALEQGYLGIIMMDGNGKDGVSAIDSFVAKLESGFDFIQGSRFLPGGAHKNTPIDRVLGIRFVFNPIINIASGFRYTDAMNGFKGCSRAFLCDPRVQPFRKIFERYSLQYYLNYIAPKLGFRVIEIPVERSYRDDNLPHSKIIGVRSRLKILLELFNVVIGQYNPK
jgi:dolichol-phosphate mannosyltransferase